MSRVDVPDGFEPTPGDGVPGEVDTTEVSAALNGASDARLALNQVFELVYAELRRIAQGVLGATPGAVTLNATALVHEAYAKLIGSAGLDLKGRQHFYSLCARTMRQIVIDHARRRLAGKRGSGAIAVELREDGVIDLARPESLVALDHALERLAERDPRLVEILQYRLFAGMELSEIAPLFGVTLRQIQRDWQRARIWLVDSLG